MKNIFTLIIFILTILFYNFSLALEDKKSEPKDEAQILVKFIPRITITEENSLKSNSWWLDKKPRVPTVFKTILKSVKKDFLDNNIKIEYKFIKNDIEKKEGIYLLSGHLIINSKKPDEFKLQNLSLSKIENEEVKLIMLPQIENFSSKSNYQGLATEFMEYNLKPKKKLSSKKNICFVNFKNKLEIQDLMKIKAHLVTELKLDESLVNLYSSEKNNYSFSLSIEPDQLLAISKMNFVKGPYEFKIDEKTLVFEPFNDQKEL